ncbi:MAG: hypothetical protein KDH93_14705 [Rhodoferax sp.]|nr:hypothetical protein [Rhodoferax sp.]MCB2006264.1 hypothetical protein [Rhodoferax sp.]
MKKPLQYGIAAATSALAALPAQAHDGHGMSGGHWHATDAWGLVGLAVALAAAVWFTRGGK